jgi:hypothetical protein
MIYSIHSNTRYLNEANAHSRAGGHHFLSENQPLPPNNGAILTVSEIIKTVMSSTAEATWRTIHQRKKRSGNPQHTTGIGTSSTSYAYTNQQQYC